MAIESLEAHESSSLQWALLNLAHSLSAASNNSEAARSIAEATDLLFHWDAFSLDLYSAETDQISAIINKDLINGQRVDVAPAYTNAAPSPIVRRVLQEGAQFILRDTAETSGDETKPFGDKSRASLSLMFAPIRKGQDVLGIVSVQSYKAAAFTNDNLQFLQAVADLCGGAFHRIRIESELRNSQARFAKAFTASPAAFAISTLDEGRFIDANERLCRMLGYKREEIIGHTSTELNIWSTPDFRNKIIEQVRQKGQTGEFEAQFRCRSGEIRDTLVAMEAVELEGKQVLLSMLVDITERKQAERGMSEAETKFRTLVEQSIVGIYIIQDGRFIYTNPTMSEMLGLSSAEIASKSLLEFIAPEDRAMTAEKVRLRMEGTIQSAHYQLRLVHHTGRIIYAEALGARTHYNGKPAILGTLLDITERKCAEMEVRKLNEELEQRVIDRTAELQLVNRELEAFAYSVSHDLRAPLRGIDGFSLALQEDYGPNLDEKGRKYINRIRTATQSMGRLIDDMLELSRISRSAMTFRSVDLSGMAEEIINELRQQFPDRKVLTVIAPGLTCRGDAALIHIALTNLLGNAWKFTRNSPEARIEFGSTLENEKRVFFVKDNGAGFDMAYQSKLFGAFQRLHHAKDYEGTGVGLATVQRVVHRHHGTIRGEGALNQGAIFYFSLPEPTEVKL